MLNELLYADGSDVCRQSSTIIFGDIGFSKHLLYATLVKRCDFSLLSPM